MKYDPQKYFKKKLREFCKTEQISYKLLLDYLFDDYKIHKVTETPKKKKHYRKQKVHSTLSYVPDTQTSVDHSIKITVEI